MSFPILSVPTFELIVPSTKKPIKCRPFLVKEEKVLLMAVEAGNENQSLEAIKQILTNCITDLKGHKIEDFALFDLEYIFLKIRSKSKGETVKLKFAAVENTECEECKKQKVININLNDIEVKFNPDITNKIQLTDEVGVIMKYPQYSLVEKLNKENKEESVELIFQLIQICIESVYDKENVYPANEISKEEYDTFIESLTPEQFEKMSSFIMNLPQLECEVDLSCKKCGRKDVQIIKGLQSFFQ
jgi:hypothetical protein